MLDSITWGNPSQRHVPILEGEGFLDKHIPQLIKFPFPKNSSKATREELNQIVDYVSVMNDNQDVLKRYKAYDYSLVKTFGDIIIQHNLGEEAIQMVDQLFDDSLSLILKLKYYFQRPRPYQLAETYKLKLFPYDSKSHGSPSYPSGHALQSRLICHVIGNHFPQLFEYFDNLAKDIEYSRMYMGLHYTSDIDFSLFCVDTILKDRDFKEKYGL